MKAVMKAIATGTAVVAVFGMSGLSSTAIAAEPVAEKPIAINSVESTEATRGEVSAQTIHMDYKLTNRSQYQMVLTGYTDPYGEDELPGIGAVVKPGQSLGFKVAQFVFAGHTVHANFDMFDLAGAKVGTYVLTMWTGARNTIDSRWTDVALQVSYDVPSPFLNPYFEATVWDPAGTVIQVPDDRKQYQAKVLEQFCTSVAACTFTPKKQEEVMSNQHAIGKVVVNDGPTESTKIFDEKYTAVTTSSVSVKTSVEATVFKVVTIGIELGLERSWTQQYEFSERVEVPIAPFHKAQIIGQEPMFRTTGDFKVTMNNVTWELKDVYFDSPDPDPTIDRAAEWYIKQTPLTPQEGQMLQLGGELPDAIVLGDGTAF